MTDTEIKIFRDAAHLAEGAAAYFAKQAEKAMSERGFFRAALAGGSTPKEMYRILAEKYKSEVDWGRVQVFWGDERCVPPDNKESNYRMAQEELLPHVAIPGENIYRMKGEDEPHAAAAAYAGKLKEFAEPDEIFNFALILLGVGEDGHTASLFPGTAALKEKEEWVAANFVPNLDAWRVTLTYPLINAAEAVLFLASGEGKADIIERILEQGDNLPAGLVRPRDGELLWFLDEDAAQGLSRKR